MRPPFVKGLLPPRATSVLLAGLVVSLIAGFRCDGDIRALLCVGDETHHPAAFDMIPTAGP